MKKFFLNMLSSFMGAWIALVLFGAVATIIVVAVVARIGSDGKTESIEKNSVLVVDLDGTITEEESSAHLDYMSLLRGEIERTQTLKQIKRALSLAKDNDRIRAVYIKCKGASASAVTRNSLRDALLDFKKSGKKVYAYGDFMTQGDFMVASVADSIFVNPQGAVDLRGLGGGTFYMKNLLDKLGITMQVVKVGKFKSAVEPYIMNEMSEPARAQLDTLYGNIWNLICKDITKSRKVSENLIDSLINQKYVSTMRTADVVKTGLIDAVCYERTMDARFASLLGVDKDDLNFISPQTVVGSSAFPANSFENEVAVLYAVGQIAEVEGNDIINCDVMVPLIVELADNDNVKALVLRVNSPGGSVFGSEQIWEALEYFKSTGKPYAVSMGDMAASGGYYISCGAQRIFADPLTITGSIGIFGMFPEFSGTLAKIGVNPQMVYTNPEADYPSAFSTLTKGQRDALQRYIDDGYEQFVARCAAGRKMKPEQIKAVGEGRVWCASDALRHGLVDQLGGLDDAVKWVANQAKLGDDYGIANYPEVEPSWIDLLPQLTGTASSYAAINSVAGEQMPLQLVVSVMRILNCKPMQALVPDWTPQM